MIGKRFGILFLFLTGTASMVFSIDYQNMLKVRKSFEAERELYDNGKLSQAASMRKTTVAQLRKIFPCGRKMQTPENCYFFRPYADSSALYMRCSQEVSGNSEPDVFDKIMFSINRDKTQKNVFASFEEIQDSAMNYVATFEPVCHNKKSFFHQDTWIDVMITLHRLKPTN